MKKTLQAICQNINFDHKTYQIEYNQKEDFVISAHCCSYIIKWNPLNQEIMKYYYPNQLSSFTSFKFVKHRKLILVVNPYKLVLLDYNLKETNSYSFEDTKMRFWNNYCISDTRLYIQVNNSIYIFSLNNLRLLKIHDLCNTELDAQLDNDQIQQNLPQKNIQISQKILFDIYGETIVHYNGFQLEILPDQICQQRSNKEAEIERILKIINNNKAVKKDITSFFFFSSSSLLIFSTSLKTFFFNLKDQSFFKVNTGNCIKVVQNLNNNSFYWTSGKNEHFVTFLDFKVTQKINVNDIKTTNTSFVVHDRENVCYLVSNESLKKLKYSQVFNQLNPQEVFSQRNQYIIHDRLEFIKTCFQKQILSRNLFQKLYEHKAISVDETFYCYLIVQQQQSQEIANLI